LKNLEDLFLDGNRITDIPEPIKKMNIKFLDLAFNKIAKINLQKGTFQTCKISTWVKTILTTSLPNLPL
jgi:Leucine-rich repeat (LRR) protein